MASHHSQTETFCGRILETRVDPAGAYVDLLVDGRRLTLTIDDPADLKRGDLVRVRRDGERVSQVVRLRRPEQVLAEPHADSWRWNLSGDAASRMLRLRQRHEIVRAIRETLYARGFVELQTPLLVPGTCPEPHIQSYQIDGGGYLVTSTEYQIKRLVVGGSTRVFTLTQNFRAGERGPNHTPEFTMLEWARAYADLREIEDDLQALVTAAWNRLSSTALPDELSNVPVNVRASREWSRITVREALKRYLGVDVDDQFSTASVQRASNQVGLSFSGPIDSELILSTLLDKLQSHLGFEVPTLLQEWPAAMTTSARLVSNNPALAERTELYISGLEIADGFPFLEDPALQEQLFSSANDARRLHGLDPVEVDQRYLAALREGIPPGAGMALGVDRLVMALTGEHEIDRVLPFAWDER